MDALASSIFPFASGDKVTFCSAADVVPSKPTMQPPLPFLISILNRDPYALATWLPFKQPRCQDSPIADLPQADWLEVRKLLLCPCSKMPTTLRTKIEQTSICLLKQQHPNPQLPITLVSVGSGGCYQELVYVAKLASAGFNNINLVLIENNRHANYIAAEQALQAICERHLGKTAVQFTKMPDLKTYAIAAHCQESLKPDCLLCLDLSDDPFSVNDQKLYAHCFFYLQMTKILKQGTLVSYSDNRKNTINPERVQRRAYAYCFTYNGCSDTPAPDHINYQLPLPNFPLSADEKAMLATAEDGRWTSVKYDCNT